MENVNKNMTSTLVEREHVHSVYSQIAPHFSDTRFKPWPKIAQFLKEQPVGSIIADVGCGNGKYLGVNPSVCTIGSDICPELVDIAKTRGHEVAVFDCLNLPYRSGVFDAAICIAVVHHLSTEERRLAALRELARIVRPGGRLLVYVWAMEQERKKFSGQDVMVPWHLQPKYSGDSKPTPKSSKSDSAKAVAKRVKKAEKMKNKQLEKRGKNERDLNTSCVTEEEVGEGEKTETGECLLGELLELCVDENHERHGQESRNQQEAMSSVEKESHHEETKPEEHSYLGGHRNSTCPSNAGRDRDTSGAPRKVSANRGHFDDSVAKANGASRIPPSSGSSELAAQGYRTFQRYYHVFRHGELTSLFSLVEGVSVLEEFYDHENWCVLAERLNIDRVA